MSGVTEDPTTRRMIEEILKMKEEHAEDPKSLLEKMSWPDFRSNESFGKQRPGTSTCGREVS